MSDVPRVTGVLDAEVVRRDRLGGYDALVVRVEIVDDTPRWGSMKGDARLYIGGQYGRKKKYTMSPEGDTVELRCKYDEDEPVVVRMQQHLQNVPRNKREDDITPAVDELLAADDRPLEDRVDELEDEVAMLWDALDG